MKKTLTPLQTTLIAAVAILLVIGGGLLFLNKPDGQLTRDEVIKLQRGDHPGGGASSNPTSSLGLGGRSPGGIPGP